MNYRTDNYSLTLQELKHWIETLPSEFDDYTVVVSKLIVEKDEDYILEFIPARGLSVYEDEQEILIMQ